LKGNIWVASIVVLILFAIGFILVFFANSVRDFYFKNFKRGIETTGLLASWIDKYPEPWFFRIFGLISFAFGIAIIMIIWGRSEN